MSGPATAPTASTPPDDLSPIKRALVEIRDLRARLAALQAAAHEPIAIVGAGVRLPGGVVDLESLWRVLGEGRDTIGPVPPGRWDARRLFHPDADHPGTMWTTQGGFLDDIEHFDAAFFGISPREAERMDPQQRLALEVAWEALEHAGIAPDRLAGTATGVFLGVGNNDYFRHLLRDLGQIDAYSGSGGSASVIAGRLSYLLGLQGPSLVVDTACSASLVAVHLACQSLRRGECELALAGGSNLIVGPEAHIAFTKARMMAPDGRCKTFDAAADGYGRGEGVALVVLRRLADARARGERILAVVRGTAVNQDGRSAGLTAPNGPSQVAVIRAALADAGLAPADIDLVEAHGTGTPLGDPIELQALAQALGADRQAPLVVGSCKTNFGHLEAAAGIAGLLKVVAALNHDAVPPHLHLTRPNPMVDWPALPLRVPTSLEAWPRADRPRRAGVSSFGFSGTNAHVVLEEAPALPASAMPADGPAATPAPLRARPRHVLALSAASEPALRELAEAFIARIDQVSQPAHGGPGGGTPVDIADLCFSANTGRARLPRRLAVSAGDLAELRRGLAAHVAGEAAPNVRSGHAAAGTKPVVAMLFSGQGAQYVGMARALDETEPTFRATLDACAAVLDPLLPRPLRAILFPADGDASWLQRTDCAQPALFAVEATLFTLWRHWGLAPAVVLGHSLGELAAAWAAGVMTLPDALRMVAARGRLMQDAGSGAAGAMATVSATPEQVAPLLAAHGVEIAAYNGPAQVVLSGAAAAVEAACAAASALGFANQRLAVSHAFHSAAMTPMLGDFEREVAKIPLQAPRLTLISNLTGEAATAAEVTSAAYWRRHVREPVRFDAGVRSAAALGVTHWLEIGPAPVLVGMAARFTTAAEGGPPPCWLASLRPKADDWTTMLDSLQQLWVAGADIDWQAFDAGRPCRRVDLPTTRWQRRRYWLDLPDQPGSAQAAAAPLHAWASLCGALDRQALLAPIGVDLTDYASRWAGLERLTVAAATAALRGAGCFAAAGERGTVESVRERLGAAPVYRHLLQRWLERLAQRGWLQRQGDEFVAAQPLPDPRLAEHLHEADTLLAGNRPLWNYLHHCCNLLGDVIGGRESALETLFPQGSYELAEALYQRSATALYVNGLAASAVQALVAARPGHAWRVLEAGAGTGGTTAALLPLFPAGSSYWFTDVTGLFLDRARAKFAPDRQPAVRASLELHTFDLEKDPAAQGLPEGRFDLVLAANAVHAVRDLRATLAGLRRLLAPGGMLLLVETTEHLAWFDISTGLIEGWQAFDDDLRTDQPLLKPAQWTAALRQAGFADARAWPPEGSEPAQLSQHVVLARVEGAPASGAGVSATPSATEVGHDATAPVAGPDRAAALTAWRARLDDALPAEREEVLRDLVRERVMAILRLAADQAPGPGDRLLDLGFDSLMAVQLRGQIGEALGLARPLPATLLFDHPTIADMAVYLSERLSPDAGAAPGPAPDAPGTPRDSAGREGAGSTGARSVPEGRAAEVAAMSDDEVEAMLMQRLGNR